MRRYALDSELKDILKSIKYARFSENLEASLDVADSFWELNTGAVYEYIIDKDYNSGYKITEAMLYDIDDWINKLKNIRQKAIEIGNKATKLH